MIIIASPCYRLFIRFSKKNLGVFMKLFLHAEVPLCSLFLHWREILFLNKSKFYISTVTSLKFQVFFFQIVGHTSLKYMLNEKIHFAWRYLLSIQWIEEKVTEIIVIYKVWRHELVFCYAQNTTSIITVNFKLVV